MLEKIFNHISANRNFYCAARNGDEFEQKFKNMLKRYGFSEIVQIPHTESAINDISGIEKINKKLAKIYFKKIKNGILLKNSLEIEKNTFQYIKNAFIFQPYGSQQFPDFIIFTKKFVIPIEIKFSKNEKGEIKLNSSRPMWNSNIPKPNAIYIYGVASENVTYFLGSDILSTKTRKCLLNFFQNIEKNEKQLHSQLLKLKNNFGIYPYVRKAYEHKKSKSTYVINNKKMIESYFSKNAKLREKNVINFLKSLHK